MILPITINLSTRGRYNSTLPLCLMSIINQTHPPFEIILTDDNEKKEFYDIPIFKEILKICKIKNIEFSYYHGESKGQTFATQICFNHTTTTLIYKMDDDNILEPNVLKILFDTINLSDEVGMVSGLILSEKDLNRKIDHIACDEIYNKIEHIYSYFNIQMCGEQDEKIKKVEHIYSNYLFRKELTNGYNCDFSPAGHREDTVFSYEIYNKGYQLLINPKSITYHLDTKGGNSIHKVHENKNDLLLIDKLKHWNIIPNKMKINEYNDKITTFVDGKEWLVLKK